jgi:hypothetical protein
VLLRKVADRVGLATALSAALPKGSGPGWRDRGMALVQPAFRLPSSRDHRPWIGAQ